MVQIYILLSPSPSFSLFTLYLFPLCSLLPLVSRSLSLLPINFQFVLGFRFAYNFIVLSFQSWRFFFSLLHLLLFNQCHCIIIFFRSLSPRLSLYLLSANRKAEIPHEKTKQLLRINAIAQVAQDEWQHARQAYYITGSYISGVRTFALCALVVGDQSSVLSII